MVYRNPTSDLVLANMFKAKWKEANREQFELETFPLPFEEYSELPEKQQLNYRYFMKSDHASFWDYEVPAIYLTDTCKLFSFTLCFFIHGYSIFCGRGR